MYLRLGSVVHGLDISARYAKILDYVSEIDDIVIFTSLVFFILVLLIPVFSLAQFQYRNLQAVISLALLQIINGSLLLLLWTYLIKHRKDLMTKDKGEGQLTRADNRYMYSGLAVIPCLYVIAMALAFFVDIQAAAVFPIIIIPVMVSLAKLFGSKKRSGQNANL
jgi:uncharacterized membrane protein